MRGLRTSHVFPRHEAQMPRISSDGTRLELGNYEEAWDGGHQGQEGEVQAEQEETAQEALRQVARTKEEGKWKDLSFKKSD